MTEDGILLAEKTLSEGLLLVLFDVENEYDRTRSDTTIGCLPRPSRRDDGEQNEAVHRSCRNQRNVNGSSIHRIH